ncbi:MAG: two-component hybrid sensor & regulator [Paucimonas sp.]|nr:two-component hybrid sensor & regulator [Paucimonas sp.]
MGLLEIDEQPRLSALKAYQILDTNREEIFDRIVEFAAKICETPIAIITFVDEQRQWFKASIGLDLPETERSISFCTHTIDREEPFIINDARADPRFHDNPLVQAPPHIAFYAGVPLKDRDGFSLGSLAVLDRVPRQLEGTQIATLQMLAEQLISILELRRQRIELEHLSAQLDDTNRQLTKQTRHLHDAQRIAKIGSWELHCPTERIALSDEIYRLFNIPNSHDCESLSAFLQSVHHDDRQGVREAIDEAARHGTTLNMEHRILRPDRGFSYVRIRGEAGFNDAGERIISGTVQDISSERQYQEQLLLLHECVARISDVVMITEAAPLEEPGPRIVFVNEAFERMTGYKSAEALGKSPRFLQGPKTQRGELDRIQRALLKGEGVHAELVNYTKKRTEFCIEIDLNPVRDAFGRISHFVSVQRDITERKRHESIV